ncbi:GNAT family N-acetyltransferase [Micromonospora cremea]|uniref:Protein N-acetyltransferase, RimJ/RimL family n=1 Tax=Micromonospora cremea TaxID=709881 RepID=A0A1N6B5G3_9ACTN|nr:GNAT family N-acetyltransferase [Micromonospora cremea]SIN41506.1 Protein N-acetyltransferase, RimJ/RimL family [Micromonospora cremea]
MLADLWPQYNLIISTPRLELRLPRDEELAALAQLAGDGVHRMDERPFLTPWTDGGPGDRARFVLQEHWGQLAGWSVARWRLGLGVFHHGHPLGVVTLRAHDFPVIREVTTSAWLGIDHQGRGYGTEARVGLLTLAFDHLGARAARTEVFQDNHASQGVSRKLGYEHDGISVDARGDEAVVSDRLRLTRQTWAQQQRPAVRVDGMAPCRPMFGL